MCRRIRTKLIVSTFLVCVSFENPFCSIFGDLAENLCLVIEGRSGVASSSTPKSYFCVGVAHGEVEGCGVVNSVPFEVVRRVFLDKGDVTRSDYCLTRVFFKR